MINLGFLGVGQMGSSITNIAAEKNFRTGIIYTSDVDIQFSEKVSDKLKLENYNGASKDRSVGRAAVIDNLKGIENFIKKTFEDCNAIIVVGSSGGGTASGGLPIIIDIALSLIPVVACITSLPFEDEGIRSKMNSLEFISEITSNKNLGNLFVIDNKKVKSSMIKSTKEEIFKLTNEKIINAFHKLYQFTNTPSKTISFDDEELLDMLNEKGCSIIDIIKISEEINNDNLMTNIIHKSLENLIFTDIENRQLVKATLLFNLRSDLQNYVNIKDILSNFDQPEKIYEAHYNIEDNDEILIMLSGLDLPEIRLTKMKEDISMSEIQIIENIKNAREKSYELNECWTQKIKPKERKLIPLIYENYSK